MKKRLFSILVCLILVMSLLPTAALADDTVEYDLWVGGVRVTSDNADDVLGDGTVSYYHNTRTLTLKGAEITEGCEYTTNEYAGIFSNAEGDPLSIVLEGENSITTPDGDISIGIYVDGTLFVSGSGSLTVEAGEAKGDNSIGSVGIFVSNIMRISEATVNAYGGDGAMTCGVRAKELDIQNDGTLFAQGGDATGSVAYSYGLSISGTEHNGSGNATIEHGHLYAIGGDAQGEVSARSYGVYGYYGTLFLDSEYAASSIYAEGGKASANGEDDSCSYGVFVHGGNVAFFSGVTTVNAGDANASYGIYAQEDGKNTGLVMFQCEESQISVAVIAGGRPVFTATNVSVSTQDGTALHADGGVIISDTLTISEPEGGYVSSDNDICNSDGDVAESANIKILTYKVSISGLKSSTLGIPVPAGWTLNETYCGEEFCNGYDSYYDALTASAEKEGYVFAGFTTEDGKLYSFNTPVTEDIKLTAKWVEESDDEIVPIVTLPSLGSSQASNPSQLELMLTQYGSSADLSGSKYFTDVHSVDHWATESIDFVVSRGIFSGTGANTFSPDAPMTRGMLAVVLYNLEGKPGHSYNGSFDDVAQGSWYEDAVYWATEKGIVTGYGTGSFGPEDNITREQLAVMLYRYAQYKGYDTTQGGMAIREFSDFDSISEYAMQAMTWAVNTGLVGGYSDNTLAPQDTATRAQVAKMLMKFIQG